MFKGLAKGKRSWVALRYMTRTRYVDFWGLHFTSMFFSLLCCCQMHGPSKCRPLRNYAAQVQNEDSETKAAA